MTKQTFKGKDGTSFTVTRYSNGYWTKSEFNSNGNPIKYEDSKGYWNKSEYDFNGNLTKFENSKGFWTKYEYDSNGNKTKYENSDGYWTKYEYDSNGNLIKCKTSTGDKKDCTKPSCDGKVVEIEGVKYKLNKI